MEEKKIKISIIVPVYNVEKYLGECIDSLLEQDLSQEEYEIIIVNDGSTDNSPQICMTYEKDNKCVSYYSQDNKGLSCARNTGLSYAEGEYVLFVDSDDYIEHNILQSLYLLANQNDTDILYSSFYLEYESGEHTVSRSFADMQRNTLYDGYSFFTGISDFGGVWKSLYKRDFIVSNDILFTPQISREDCDFNLRLIPLAKRILISDNKVYHYRLFGESLTRTKNIIKMQFNLFSEFVIVANVTRFSNKMYFPQEVQTKYKRYLNSSLIGACILLYKNRKIYDSIFINKCIGYSFENKLLPIRGRTNSWKTTAMIPLINFVTCFYRIK